MCVNTKSSKISNFKEANYFFQLWIFSFFIYFLRFEFFCGNTIVLLKLCVENSKTKIYLSNQHLAKENENVSWTAKKLCHHTYHAIHSINIRTESKLFCLLCWTGWNWFMNRLGIAHNMMHCTLDLCPDQTSLGRNIVYQFKVKESYCLIYILSCNSRFLSGLSVCSDFWWSVILTRTNYMGRLTLKDFGTFWQLFMYVYLTTNDWRKNSVQFLLSMQSWQSCWRSFFS